jgi:hypothetical protein
MPHGTRVGYWWLVGMAIMLSVAITEFRTRRSRIYPASREPDTDAHSESATGMLGGMGTRRGIADMHLHLHLEVLAPSYRLDTLI